MRGCGCTGRPAFRTPSLSRGWDVHWQSSGAWRREIAESWLFEILNSEIMRHTLRRRPRESGDPSTPSAVRRRVAVTRGINLQNYNHGGYGSPLSRGRQRVCGDDEELQLPRIAERKRTHPPR